MRFCNKLIRRKQHQRLATTPHSPKTRPTAKLHSYNIQTIKIALSDLDPRMVKWQGTEPQGHVTRTPNTNIARLRLLVCPNQCTLLMRLEDQQAEAVSDQAWEGCRLESVGDNIHRALETHSLGFRHHSEASPQRSPVRPARPPSPNASLVHYVCKNRTKETYESIPYIVRHRSIFPTPKATHLVGSTHGDRKQIFALHGSPFAAIGRRYESFSSQQDPTTAVDMVYHIIDNLLAIYF